MIVRFFLRARNGFGPHLAPQQEEERDLVDEREQDWFSAFAQGPLVDMLNNLVYITGRKDSVAEPWANPLPNNNNWFADLTNTFWPYGMAQSGLQVLLELIINDIGGRVVQRSLSKNIHFSNVTFQDSDFVVWQNAKRVINPDLQSTVVENVKSFNNPLNTKQYIALMNYNQTGSPE
jgi:hypothetical protein